MSYAEPWERLLGSPAGTALHLPMWLLRRHGRALLLLPQNRHLAAKALDLYPAQTSAARLARFCLRNALRWGLRPGLSKVTIPIAQGNPLVDFLTRVAGLAGQLPPFGMLAGNPQTEGQRCIFLLFGEAGIKDQKSKIKNPTAVVKAGSGTHAIRLIEREADFLTDARSGTPGVPTLRSVLRHSQVCAFATDFLAGGHPPANDWDPIERLLTSWIRRDQKISLAELSLWRSLEAACSSALPRIVQQIRSTDVRPTIFHGDFAPWNIKVDHGRWVLLDWERGELNGIPAWDWFHFVIQTAVLVEHASAAAILEKLERLFIFEPFLRYAEQAGIQHIERPLAIAYLHHCLHVLRPTEGVSSVRSLSEVAEKRWSVSTG